jgi:peroxidase
VKGCDASVLLSAPNGDDEHNAGADVTLSADALDLVNKIKAAIDSNSQCTNKVSCADILAMAARDVVSLVSTPTSF